MYKHVRSDRVDAIETLVNVENAEIAYHTMGSSTTIISGGIMSHSGGTTIDITAGEGVVVKHNHTLGEPFTIDQYYHVPVQWDNIVGYEIDASQILNNNITFISIDENGSPVQTSTKPSFLERHSLIQLGVAVHVNRLVINAINHEHGFHHFAGAQFADFVSNYGFINITGNNIRPEELGGGATMTIRKTSGILFYPGIGYHIDQDDPNRLPLISKTPSGFQYRYSNGLSDPPAGERPTIDPNHLDDGLGGLTVMSNNYWSVHRVYIFTSNSVKIQRGRTEYKDLSDAVASINTDPNYEVEPSIADNGLLRSAIVVRQGSTDIENKTQAIFFDVAANVGISESQVSVTTLQNTYDNSIGPAQITTTTALGGVCIKTGDDSKDTALCVIDALDATRFSVTGEGTVTSGPINGRDIVVDGASLDGKADKTYVDASLEGLSVKDCVSAATTAALSGTPTYTATTIDWTGFTPPPTIDGVTVPDISVAVGWRVLVKDEVDTKRNGIYKKSSNLVWERTADMDEAEEVSGAYCFVCAGTVNAGKGFVTLSGITTLGGEAISWTQFSSSALPTWMTSIGSNVIRGRIQVPVTSWQSGGFFHANATATHNLGHLDYSVIATIRGPNSFPIWHVHYEPLISTILFKIGRLEAWTNQTNLWVDYLLIVH